MNKVYAVTCGSYEDQYIIAVFMKLINAQEYITKNKPYNYNINDKIDEYSVLDWE